MNERYLAMPVYFGTPVGDRSAVIELPKPWLFLGVKASESNVGAATLAVADSGAALIVATAIGQSGNPVYLEPTTPEWVAANEAVTLTLDYDGAGSTAGQNICAIVIGLIGEG